MKIRDFPIVMYHSYKQVSLDQVNLLLNIKYSMKCFVSKIKVYFPAVSICLGQVDDETDDELDETDFELDDLSELA